MTKVFRSKESNDVLPRTVSHILGVASFQGTHDTSAETKAEALDLLGAAKVRSTVREIKMADSGDPRLAALQRVGFLVFPGDVVATLINDNRYVVQRNYGW